MIWKLLQNILSWNKICKIIDKEIHGEFADPDILLERREEKVTWSSIRKYFGGKIEIRNGHVIFCQKHFPILLDCPMRWVIISKSRGFSQIFGFPKFILARA